MLRRNLLALLVLIPFVIYEGPVMAQAVGTISSTAISTSTLQTYSVAKTITATANHVVQPFGKYTLTKTGTIYAANGVDNVTITLSSGFPSFSSYVGNSTYQAWASGCQKEQDQEKGANLVISYIGTACGIAPTLKVSFSPLPSSTTSCSVSWASETYSWCGDSGISYNSGVVTIVPPSATFDVDPTLVQKSSSACTPGAGGTSPCACAYGSNVTAGNILVGGVTGYGTAGITISSPSDTLGNTWTKQNGTAAIDVAGFYNILSLYTATASSSGADTITFSFNQAGVNSFTFCYELSSNAVIGKSEANTGTGSTVQTTKSVGYNSGDFLLALAIAAGTGSTLGAGSGFTYDSSGFSYTGAQRQVTSTSGTTQFPFTATGGTITSGWAIVGIDFMTLLPETILLDMSVNAPPGGAIVYSGTTISTSSTLTITATTTWTVTGVPFASYIFDGWSGFSCSDLINPVQTCSVTTVSSYTTSSTVSSTLTAQFSGGGGGATTSSPDYTWLLLLPFAVLAIALILRRR